jgi:hypothetical protein
MATGYAGHERGLNNGDFQHVRSIGPIPTGDWTIAATDDSPTACSVDLEPQEETRTFGRSLFRIHGGNSSAGRTASRGCIVLPRTIRLRLSAARGQTLRVVP